MEAPILLLEKCLRSEGEQTTKSRLIKAEIMRENLVSILV